MKNNINAFLLLYILIFFSCNYERKSLYYNAIIRKFNSTFVNHFPEFLTNGQIDITENGEYDVTRLFLLVKESNNTIKKLKDSLKKKAVAKYSANESCLFIVNKFTTEKNFTYENKANKKEIIEYLNKPCLSGKKPIANFWGLYDNIHTISHLPKEYTIYVLEAKKGLYWDKKHRSNGKQMPDYWKHGYSKGVAINDKTNEIIYWFVLW